MGKKSAPAAPDYKGAAEATAASSAAAQSAATAANRPNINTPWGSETWSQAQSTDPATGKPVTNWTQNINLSPAEQATLTAQQNVALGKANVAQGAIGNMQQAYSKPFDWSNLQAMGQAPQAGQLANVGTTSGQFQNVDPSQYQNQLSNGPNMAMLTSLLRGGVQAGSLTGAPDQSQFQNAQGPGGYQSVGGPSSWQSAPGQAAYGQNPAQSQFQGAAGAGGLMSGFDTSKLPQMQAGGGGWSGTINGGATGSLDMGMLGQRGDLVDQSKLNPWGNGVDASVGDASRQRYEQLLMDKLRPENDRAQQALELKLANQGLTPGSAAYQRAMELQGGIANKNQLNVFEQGGREQANQFGMALEGSQLANSMRGQSLAEQLGISGQMDAQRQAGLGEQQAQANLINQGHQLRSSDQQATGSLANQSASIANQGIQIGNEAAMNAYNQQMGLANLYNSAQGTQFNQGMQQAGFNNQNAQNAFGQGMTLANRGDTNANNQWQQAFQGNQANNANAANAWQQGLQGANANNAAASNNWAQGFQANQANNQNAANTFNQGMQQANLANQNQGTQFNQGMQNATFGNQTQNQLYNQLMGSAGLQNQNAQTGYNMATGAAGVNNANAQNAFGQSMQQAGMFNQNQGVDFAQQQATANYQNQLRQQQIAEQQMQRNQPLNEMNAILSGTQIGMPTFPGFQNAQAAAPTNYLGAAGMQGQSDMAAYNAKQQGTQGLMSGVGSIAAAGIMAF